MFFKYQALKYRLMNAQGADGGEGGDGHSNSEQQPDAAAIQRAVDEAVAGLKAKNGELLGKLKERDEALKRFDGINPEAVHSILKRFTDDEEAKAIAEGRIEDVLTKRTERMKADFDKTIGAAHTERDQAAARAKAFEARVLDDSIRAAAGKAGLHQQAIDDALFRGRAMFSLDEQGNAVALGEDGRPVLGKDGKSPFTPCEWLEGMKEKAPHWFPASASGGGAANSSSGGSGKTMTRANFARLPPAEQAATVRGGTQIID